MLWVLAVVVVAILIFAIKGSGSLNEKNSPRPGTNREEDGSAKLLKRAKTHYDAGRRPEAIADLTRAIEIDPQCAEAYISRAGVYHGMQRYPRSSRGP